MKPYEVAYLLRHMVSNAMAQPVLGGNSAGVLGSALREADRLYPLPAGPWRPAGWSRSTETA